jgi:hypothetical protein
VDNSTSQENTASLDLLIGVASFGMSEQASVLKHSEDTTMKCSMQPLTAQEISWPLPQLTDLPECIMCSLEHAQLFYKGMKTRYPKSSLILKEIRLSQLQATSRAEYGT